MLKHSVFIIVLLSASLLVFAQDPSTSLLNKYCQDINDLQYSLDGKTYLDPRDNIVYTIGFPTDNFLLSPKSRYATKSVYKKWDKEVLAITEDIDLTKMKDIVEVQPSGKATASVLKVIFPTGVLKTKIIENGIVKFTMDEDYLEFFFSDADQKKQIVDKLYELSAGLNGGRPVISRETKKEGIKDIKQDPSKEIKPQLVKETKPLPLKEPKSDPVKELKTKPAKEPKQEIKQEPKTETKKVNKPSSSTYSTTLNQAREYFDNNDWENAKMAYAEVNRMKPNQGIVDTIAIIENNIAYDAILVQATEKMKSAAAGLKLESLETIAEKIAVCKQVIGRYEETIENLRKALQYNPMSNIAKAMINDAQTEIGKINKEIDNYEVDAMVKGFRTAKRAAEDAKKEKDYKSALRYYKEAFEFIKNPRLQQVLNNYSGDLEYIQAQIGIMEFQAKNQ